MIKILHLLCLVTITLSFGCGKKKSDGASSIPPQRTTTTGNVDESTSFLLATKADLPDCVEDRTGYLAYVTDEDAFYSCDGATWTEVNISGSDGRDGDTGPSGQAGPIGPSGSGGVTVYSGGDIEIGRVAGADWPSVYVLVNGGTSWLDLQPHNGKVLGGMRAHFDSNETYTTTQVVYAASNCTSNAAVSFTVNGQINLDGIWVNQAYPVSYASGGGVAEWHTILSYSSGGGGNFNYNSLATYDANRGDFVCANSSGSMPLISGGGVIGAALTYSTFGGVLSSGGGLISYPFTAPMYFGP